MNLSAFEYLYFCLLSCTTQDAFIKATLHKYAFENGNNTKIAYYL